MKILSEKKQNGFTLLGVLISAFIVVIVVSVLVALLAQSYSVALNSKNRFIAVNLAKEGVELVRNMRDGNWLFYPDLTGYSTIIKWRGEATDTLCGSDWHCSRLRSVCNGDYIIDATNQDLRLQLISGGNEKLNISNGVYTHGTGDSTPFTRTINISSTSGDCDDLVDSLALNPVAPAPIEITSTVTWREQGTNVDKTVQLKKTLSDRFLSRGVAPDLPPIVP